MGNIKICERCDGEGTTRHDVGYHSTEWVTETCKKCNGTGRVKEFHYYLSFSSDIDMQKFYPVDKRIHEIIREFENSLKK